MPLDKPLHQSSDREVLEALYDRQEDIFRRMRRYDAVLWGNGRAGLVAEAAGQEARLDAHLKAAHPDGVVQKHGVKGSLLAAVTALLVVLGDLFARTR